MIWALLLVPAVSGLAALAIRSNVPRRALLVLAAAAHLRLVYDSWVQWSRQPSPGAESAWMALDSISLLFLGITSVLFLAAAVYSVGYLGRESRNAPRQDEQDDLPFDNFPEAIFTGCLLFFLSTMTLVTVSRHLGLMWVGVEATTLASAPLIYFHRHRRSLEAAWKYLLICSVGIALALLGNFFTAVAARSTAAGPIHLTIDQLTAHATSLDPLWLKAAFLLFLVGYGTKMGLAPLHTGLPDAHSEAPSVVSALLSGALLNCAFLTILRAHMLLSAARMASFSADLLVLFGLVSMVVAAVFILGQSDFKRMLAYSSVEHMGILALGVGIGGAAAFGAMFHTVNHALTKTMLFLAAGNILALYRTKSIAGVRGMLCVMPATGAIWLAGFLAIAGSPPFGPFLSELTILKGAIDAGRWLAAGVYLSALAVVFIGMATIVLGMVYGPVPEEPLCGRREPPWSTAPAAALGLCVLTLGIYVPAPLVDLLRASAAALGAS